MVIAEPAARRKVGRLGLINQLFRFVVIGAGCAVLDFCTFGLLLSFGSPFWLAKTTGFVVGTSVSYLVNRKLTFTGASSGNTLVRALGFALVYTVTLGVNVGTAQALHLTLPGFVIAYGEQLRYALCWVVGQGLGTLINFVMLKWVVFRD